MVIEINFYLLTEQMLFLLHIYIYDKVHIVQHQTVTIIPTYH